MALLRAAPPAAQPHALALAIDAALRVVRPPHSRDAILQALLSAVSAASPLNLADRVEDALLLGGLPRMLLLVAAEPLAHQGALAKVLQWAASSPEAVAGAQEEELLRVLRYLALRDKCSEGAMGLLLHTHVTEETLLQAAQVLQAAGHSTRWEVGKSTLLHYIFSEAASVNSMNDYMARDHDQREAAFRQAAARLEQAEKSLQAEQANHKKCYGRIQESQLQSYRQGVDTARQQKAEATAKRPPPLPPRLEPLPPHCVPAAARMLAQLAPEDICALPQTPLQPAIRALDVAAVHAMLSALPAGHGLSMSSLILDVCTLHHECSMDDDRCQPHADEDGVVSRLACAQLCILQLLINKAGPAHVCAVLGKISSSPSPTCKRECKEMLLEAYDRLRSGEVEGVPSAAAGSWGQTDSAATSDHNEKTDHVA